MPRLRYLKNYSPIEIEEYGNEDDDENSLEPERFSEQSQKGWWSQANIISTLPEAKIREAIVNYRLLISSLELELLRRGSGLARQTNPVEFLLSEETRKKARYKTGQSVQSFGTRQRRVLGILKKYNLQSRCGVSWMRILNENQTGG